MPKAILSIVAGVLLVASLVFALQAWLHARNAATNREHLVRAQAGTSDALRHAESRIATAQGRTNAREETTPIAAAAVNDAGDRPPHSDHVRVARIIPELQAMHLVALRARFNITYAPLFRTLKLSPTQAAQFCDHLMKREELRSDLEAAAEVQKLSDNEETIRRFTAEAERKYEAAQHALLGSVGARYALEFERTIEVRKAVSTIATMATLAGTPLTSQQIDRLLGVFITAIPRHPDGSMDAYHLDWTKVDAQAREFLSSSQWAILTTLETDSLARFSYQLDHAIKRARESDDERKAAAGEIRR